MDGCLPRYLDGDVTGNCMGQRRVQYRVTEPRNVYRRYMRGEEQARDIMVQSALQVF
jgi:hypothetical protein